MGECLRKSKANSRHLNDQLQYICLAACCSHLKDRGGDRLSPRHVAGICGRRWSFPTVKALYFSPCTPDSGLYWQLQVMSSLSHLGIRQVPWLFHWCQGEYPNICHIHHHPSISPCMIQGLAAARLEGVILQLAPQVVGLCGARGGQGFAKGIQLFDALKYGHGTKANYLRVLDLSLAPKEKLLRVLMD